MNALCVQIRTLRARRAYRLTIWTFEKYKINFWPLEFFRLFWLVRYEFERAKHSFMISYASKAQTVLLWALQALSYEFERIKKSFMILYVSQAQNSVSTSPSSSYAKYLSAQRNRLWFRIPITSSFCVQCTGKPKTSVFFLKCTSTKLNE